MEARMDYKATGGDIRQYVMCNVNAKYLGDFLLDNEEKFKAKQKVNGFIQAVIRLDGSKKYEGETSPYYDILPEEYEDAEHFQVFVRLGNVPTEKKDDFEERISKVTYAMMTNYETFLQAIAGVESLVEDFANFDADICLRFPYLDAVAMEYEKAQEEVAKAEESARKAAERVEAQKKKAEEKMAKLQAQLDALKAKKQ